MFWFWRSLLKLWWRIKGTFNYFFIHIFRYWGWFSATAWFKVYFGELCSELIVSEALRPPSTTTTTMKGCTHWILLLLCVSHPAPPLHPTLRRTQHYNHVCLSSQHALSLTAQLPWQLMRMKNLEGHASKESAPHRPPGQRRLTWQRRNLLCKSSSGCLNCFCSPTDHSAGEAGVWLPRLPVGAHHDQLLPRHRGHSGPVWRHPVQVALHYHGEETALTLRDVEQF